MCVRACVFVCVCLRASQTRVARKLAATSSSSQSVAPSSLLDVVGRAGIAFPSKLRRDDVVKALRSQPLVFRLMQAGRLALFEGGTVRRGRTPSLRKFVTCIVFFPRHGVCS